MATLFRNTFHAPVWDAIRGNWDDVPGTFDAAIKPEPNPKLFHPAPPEESE